MGRNAHRFLYQTSISALLQSKKTPDEKIRFIFEKVPDFLSLLWYVARLTGGAFMKDTIAELWHGNICPQTESRNNTPAMKELMEYMARHHEAY